MSSSSGGQYPHQAEFYRAAVELLVRKWGESEVRIVIPDHHNDSDQSLSGDHH